MALIQVKDMDLNDYSQVIHALKNGAFLTEFNKEKPKKVILENTGGYKGYQFKEFPYDEFKLLKEYGFIWLESGNFDTGEDHYIWDIFDCYLFPEERKPYQE